MSNLHYFTLGTWTSWRKGDKESLDKNPRHRAAALCGSYSYLFLLLSKIPRAQKPEELLLNFHSFLDMYLRKVLGISSQRHVIHFAHSLHRPLPLSRLVSAQPNLSYLPSTSPDPTFPLNKPRRSQPFPHVIQLSQPTTPSSPSSILPLPSCPNATTTTVSLEKVIHNTHEVLPD